MRCATGLDANSRQLDLVAKFFGGDWLGEVPPNSVEGRVDFAFLRKRLSPKRGGGKLSRGQFIQAVEPRLGLAVSRCSSSRET